VLGGLIVRTSLHLATTRRMAREHARRGELGAILILALVFVTVVLTLAVSLLTLAYTGSTSLRAFRIERTRRYAADGALQSAVQYVKQDPTLGQTTGSGTCSLTYPIVQGSGAGEPALVAASSTLTVTCEATPGTTSGGVDVDGGQRIRDVTFTVTCRGDPPGVKGVLSCDSSSSTTTVLGRARVRYEIDYELVPSGSTCAPSVTECSAHNARAVVPKVVTWSLKG
jgi:hypothetical protein